MGVYLAWLQVGLGHHTRKPNRWWVPQRCLTTSCCSSFRQPSSSCKTCVNGWQRQVASFKRSNRLISKWSRDFSSMASHEPGFKSNILCLGHAKPSWTGSWTSCINLTSIGSTIASGMVAATTAAHPRTGGFIRFHSTLNFEPWMALIESKLTFSKWNENLIVHYELWRSILKMDIIWCKNWPCDCVTIYPLNYHFCWYCVFLKPI